MSTVSEAAQLLADAGVASARHDAEMLACHLLGVGRHALSRADLGPRYDEVVRRRAGREPLQYIVGSAPFRHVDVLVGPGVFIPRPETELVAGWVIDAVGGLDAPLVVDLCTGPGTIALAVASEVPAARVFAVDSDPTAVAWARTNAEHHAVALSVHESHVVDALTELDGTVDAVVANPPYIPISEADRLDPEVRDHEPPHALYADDDGLAMIGVVLVTAVRLLRSGGVVVIEHGDQQGPEVSALLTATRFVDVADHRDLSGRSRFTTGRAG